MGDNLGEKSMYSEIMCAVFTDIKESVAIRKFRETTEILLSLGYSREEIKGILSGVLNTASCS